jgi:hypothetical protein
MAMHETFNRSSFSRFLNSPAGRLFRLCAGAAFLAVGLVFRHHLAGLAAIVWSALPITAGAFDVCYISAALGGPLSGARIRSSHGTATGAAPATSRSSAAERE